MQKTILILILLLHWLALFPQSSGSGGVDVDIAVNYGILQDHGYSFKSIKEDSTLHFTKDSLHPAQGTKYWFKIEATNNSAYAQPCFITVLPNLNNTFFHYNEDKKSWIVQQGGISVPTDKGRLKGRTLLQLQGSKTTTVYVLVSLGRGHLALSSIRPKVILEKAEMAEDRDLLFTTAWIVCLAILLILFLNSVHIYYRFRDATIIYFLMVQLSGIIYLTAYRGFFRVIFPGPPLSIHLEQNGSSSAYSMNEVFMHLSVAIIIFSFIQMTRQYLQTKNNLPKWDGWLKYSMYGYLIFTAVVGLINISGFYLDVYTLLFDNILVFLTMSLSVATSIVAYRRKLPSALVYLFAHLLPMLFLIGIAAYHVLISFNNGGQLLLPDFAVISQALCFSAAIVSRIKILQDNLLAKEEESHRLTLDIGKAEFRHRELALENVQILSALRAAELEQKIKQLETHQLNLDIAQHQAANKELNEKLDVNRRELASTTLYVVQKNALLAELKTQIEYLNKQSHNGKVEQLSGIKSLLQSSLQIDDDWSRFKLHFEQVHPRFFETLQLKYPSLTKNELRLYSYFHINLSTKEIATLLNIDPASVRRAKTRLYKKMAVADKEFPSNEQS